MYFNVVYNNKIVTRYSELSYVTFSYVRRGVHYAYSNVIQGICEPGLNHMSVTVQVAWS